MKLTKAHLKIYKHYRSDIDMWARSRKKSGSTMTDEHWGEIDQLLSRLELMQKGLALDSFNAETKERLSRLCDTSET